MKLVVTVDGRPGDLQLERAGTECRFAYHREDMDQGEREASVLECEPGIYSILLDGRSYEAKVVPGPNGYYVDLLGHRSTVEVRDPRTFSRKGRAGTGDGKQNIIAPMPGKVVRLLVKVGDVVEAGAGVAVVEAMKMQNEMKASKAGTVTTVSCREGDTVKAGDTLAVIE